MKALERNDCRECQLGENDFTGDFLGCKDTLFDHNWYPKATHRPGLKCLLRTITTQAAKIEKLESREKELVSQNGVTCPFCGESDFDATGLKSHLNHGDCEFYNATIDVSRVF